MFTGKADVSEVRVGLFADLIGRAGHCYQAAVPVASEDPVQVLAGLPKGTTGFQVYSCGTGVIRVGDEGYPFRTDRIEEGPVYRVGRIVSDRYLRGRLPGERDAFATGKLRDLRRDAKDSGLRVLLWGEGELELIRNDVRIIDEKGRPVTDVLDDPPALPEGVYAGGRFHVLVGSDDLLEVGSQPGGVEGRGEVGFEVAAAYRETLSAELAAAGDRVGVRRPQPETLFLRLDVGSEPFSLRVHDKLRLDIAWNGYGLRVEPVRD